ncbi:MAG: YjbF family lipoprotein [Pseudomonadota bacterium]
MLILVLLGGCSSEGPTDLGRVGLLALDAFTAEESTPAPQSTRAELEATGAAIIGVAAESQAKGYAAAVADNDGYVTYQDGAGRALVLLGGAIARTHGYGQDLLATRYSREDPVAHPRPIDTWPGQVTREHQFRVRGGDGYQIVFTCLYARGPRTQIEVLGKRHTVVVVEERCANRSRSVINTYWVGPENGRIWRSEQWIGPYVQPLTLDTVVPYDAPPQW